MDGWKAEYVTTDYGTGSVVYTKVLAIIDLARTKWPGEEGRDGAGTYVEHPFSM